MNILQILRNNFDPLRHPNFRLYLGGQAISLIGTWLQATAQAWVVWELTKSEAALGIVTLLNSLPVLFLSAYAGVWADRLDRRKLLIGTQIVAMILAFILAFLTQTNLIQIWHVYLLALALGVVTALDLPTQQAFLGDLAGVGEVRKAVNLNITVLQISRVLGPSLAGLIVARVGIAPAFWLNGLSFLAVILSLIRVRVEQAQPKVTGKVDPFHQIIEGIRYVRTQPRLQDLFLFAVLLTFFVFSVIMNVLPAVAEKLLNGNAETLGQLMASSGAGALIAVLFLAPTTQTLKRSGVVLVGACLWIAVWLFVFGNSRSLPLSIFSLFMGSIGAPTVMTMAMGLIQSLAPNAMRGRLASLFTTISFGFQPIAAIWIGGVAENFGVDRAIQVNAILLAILTLTLVATRRDIWTWIYAENKSSRPYIAPVVQAELTPLPPDAVPTRQSGDR
jgi:MFS family permease